MQLRSYLKYKEVNMDYGTNADYARTGIESGTSIEDMIAIFLIGTVYLLVMTVYAIFLPLSGS